MKLILHHALKDLRAQRWLLAAWAAALLTLAAVDAIRPDLLLAEPGRRRTVDDPAGWVLLSVASLRVLLSWLIAVRIVHADPLDSTEAFWLTRPLSLRTLLAAKAGAIGGLFVGVPAAVVAVVLAANGVSAAAIPGLVLRWLLIDLVLLLPIVLVATLTRDLARVVLFLGVMLAGWAVLQLGSRVGLRCRDVLGVDRLPGRHLTAWIGYAGGRRGNGGRVGRLALPDAAAPEHRPRGNRGPAAVRRPRVGVARPASARHGTGIQDRTQLDQGVARRRTSRARGRPGQHERLLADGRYRRRDRGHPGHGPRQQRGLRYLGRRQSHVVVSRLRVVRQWRGLLAWDQYVQRRRAVRSQRAGRGAGDRRARHRRPRHRDQPVVEGRVADAAAVGRVLPAPGGPRLLRGRTSDDRPPGVGGSHHSVREGRIGPTRRPGHDDREHRRSDPPTAARPEVSLLRRRVANRGSAHAVHQDVRPNRLPAAEPAARRSGAPQGRIEPVDC